MADLSCRALLGVVPRTAVRPCVTAVLFGALAALGMAAWLGPAPSPSSFQAWPNFTSDLQAAIRRCSGKDCRLRLPAGAFTLSAGITLPPGVTLEGASMGSTKITFAADGPAITISAADPSPEGGAVTIRNLTLSGPGPGSWSVGISIGAGSVDPLSPARVEVDHVRLIHFTVGLSLAGAAAALDLTEDSFESNATGISGGDVPNSRASVVLLASLFLGNTTVAVSAGAGTWTLVGTRFEGNSQGIYTGAEARLTCAGCVPSGLDGSGAGRLGGSEPQRPDSEPPRGSGISVAGTAGWISRDADLSHGPAPAGLLGIRQRVPVRGLPRPGNEFPHPEVPVAMDGKVILPPSRLLDLQAITARTIGGTEYADQFPGTDIGAKINAAIAALPPCEQREFNQTWRHCGIVEVTSGSYGMTTPVRVDSPMVSVRGQGSTTTTLDYHGAGCAFVFTSVPFNSGGEGGLELSGLTIDGDRSGSGACGVKYEDITSFTLRDVDIRNFRAAGSVALWAQASSKWDEREQIEAQLYNNSIGFRIEDDNPTLPQATFGYGDIELGINTYAGQVGILQDNGPDVAKGGYPYLSYSDIHVVINGAGGDTGIDIESGAWDYDVINIHIEGSTTGVRLAKGVAVKGVGSISDDSIGDAIANGSYVGAISWLKAKSLGDDVLNLGAQYACARTSVSYFVQICGRKGLSPFGVFYDGTPVLGVDGVGNLAATGSAKWGGGPPIRSSASTGSGPIVLAGSPALTAPTIGGGSIIHKVLLSSGRLDFKPLLPGTCEEMRIAVRGARTEGVASTSPDSPAVGLDIFWSARVSAPGVVAVRICNPTGVASGSPPSAWRVEVVQ